MDAVTMTIIQGLMGALGLVLWYLYTEQSKEVKRLGMELLNYKVHVSERYVSNDKLNETVNNLNKNVEQLSAGVLRIETRLNSQMDNRHLGN
jgi:hypothetical protein